MNAQQYQEMKSFMERLEPDVEEIKERLSKIEKKLNAVVRLEKRVEILEQVA